MLVSATLVLGFKDVRRNQIDLIPVLTDMIFWHGSQFKIKIKKKDKHYT